MAKTKDKLTAAERAKQYRELFEVRRARDARELAKSLRQAQLASGVVVLLFDEPGLMAQGVSCDPAIAHLIPDALRHLAKEMARAIHYEEGIEE